MKAFRKVQIQDKSVSLFQDNVDQVVAQLALNPFVDAVKIDGIVLTSGKQTKVAHKIKRKPSFCVLCVPNANAVVWESLDLRTDTYVVLNTTANCQISLIVG